MGKKPFLLLNYNGERIGGFDGDDRRSRGEKGGQEKVVGLKGVPCHILDEGKDAEAKRH